MKNDNENDDDDDDYDDDDDAVNDDHDHEDNNPILENIRGNDRQKTERIPCTALYKSSRKHSINYAALALT